MVFDHKPGDGRLFRNTDRLSNPKKPHMSGSANLPDGRRIRIAVWDNGGETLNVKVQWPREEQERDPQF